MTEPKPSCVVVLATADFNATLMTNKQRVALILNEHLRVFYINSLGLRRIRFTRSDLVRVFGRLFNHPKTIPIDNSIRVVNPMVFPSQSKLFRSINSLLLNAQVDWITRNYRKNVLWTFSPITLGLESTFQTTVYHSVDLLHTVPGIDEKTIIAAERDLLSTKPIAIASSVGVRDHLLASGADKVLLWENVGVLPTPTVLPNRSARGIFIGHLTDTKVDFDLVHEILENGMALAFAGPLPIDGTKLNKTQLKVLSHPNMTLLGVLHDEDLAFEVLRSSFAIIPYKISKHTAGIFPLKVYEYLSTGTPTVATKIFSLVNSPNKHLGLHLAETNDAFITICSRLSKQFDYKESLKIVTASKPHNWLARGAEITALAESITNSRAN